MKIITKLRVILRVFGLLGRREKWQFTGVMATAFFMAFFQVLGVASILPFMNLLLQPESIHENRWTSQVYDYLGFTSTESFIFFIGVLLLGIIITGNVISILGLWLKHHFAWRISHNLSTALLKKYLSLPYVYFLNHHSADLGKNILSEVNRLTKSVMVPLVEMLISATLVIFIVTMLFLVNPVVSLISLLLFAGSYAFIYVYVSRWLLASGKKRFKANTNRFKAASEALMGIKDIKILGCESFFVDRFVIHSRKMSILIAWHAVFGQAPRYLLETVAFGGVIVLTLVLMLVEGGAHQAIPIVSFFAFAGYRLMPALQNIFIALTSVQFNRAAFTRIYDDMVEGDFQGTDTATHKLPEPLLLHHTVHFDHISFWYPNTDEAALKNINLDISRHTSVAIVGSTGSGKTTLVDVFLGLLTPQQGKIVVDDIEVCSDNIRNWQRNLGYVPQQIFLSDDTIARNIAFGLPDNDIDHNRIEEVTCIANLHDFIVNDLPKGYETVVGERGVRLSGGQRQRIGIARALYHDPEILVLDEATSALDGITEAAVLQAMDNASRLKTLLVIAHRLTTIIHCDIIYMMDRGQIVANGTYAELMQSNLQFRAMAKEGSVKRDKRKETFETDTRRIVTGRLSQW